MVKERTILILGAGENGLVVQNIFFLNGRKKVLFLDDRAKGPDVVGPLTDFKKFPEADFFVSFGNDSMRTVWYQTLTQAGATLINVIHPRASVEKSVQIGKNVMIGALTYVNINTHMGNNVIINNHCTIEHDNVIEDHVQIAPGVTTGGKVTIKKGSFIGIGSVIIDHLVIEEYNKIGAGAVVVDDIKEKHGLYLGVPAKKVKSLSI